MNHPTLRALLLAAPLWLSACASQVSPTQAPEAEPHALNLADEFNALGHLLGARGVWTLILAFVALSLIAALLRSVAQGLRRRLGDSDSRLGRLLSLAFIAAVALALYVVVRQFFAIAPLVTSILLAILGLTLGFSARGLAQDLLGATRIAVKGHIHPGLTLEMGSIGGTVEQVGALSTRILTLEGAVLHVPNRVFINEAFTTRQPRRTAQVVFSQDLGEPVTQLWRERVRIQALLCPYRQVDSDVSVSVDEKNHTLVSISFLAPSDALAREASLYLERALSAALSNKTPAPNDAPY